MKKDIKQALRRREGVLLINNTERMFPAARMSPAMRIGHGYDVHRFCEDRPFILGGINIPHTHGLAGHSDADVLIHAIIDSILGALNLGDIGRHFPDSDGKYKGIDSCILLDDVVKIMHSQKYNVGNIDCTVVCQQPKLMDYIPLMQKKLSGIFNIPDNCINIKAKTEEGLGFTGEKLGVKAYAVCLLFKEE